MNIACIKKFLVAANIISMEDSVWKPLLKNSVKCKLHGLLYEIRQSRINNTCMLTILYLKYKKLVIYLEYERITQVLLYFR